MKFGGRNVKDDNDWRLMNQLDYLYEKALIRKKYRSSNNSRDHDHCEFCSEKFVHGVEGFCTEDEYYWICTTCYNDFKKMFRWKLI